MTETVLWALLGAIVAGVGPGLSYRLDWDRPLLGLYLTLRWRAARVDEAAVPTP